jgi:hypothetical protein
MPPDPPRETVVVAPVLAPPESTVVRSIYLYAMCAVAVALLIVGLITTATAAVRIAAPDSGQRDTLDRVSVGVANIADRVVGLIDPKPSLEQFCAEDQAGLGTDTVTAECKRAYRSADFGSMTSQVSDVTNALRGEIRSQIRWAGLGRLLAGLFAAIAGFVLLRIHRPKVAAYRS